MEHSISPPQCPVQLAQQSAESANSPEKKFFLELMLYLGMALDSKTKLEANRLFSGPSGFLCRVQTRRNKSELNARPEVVLPLALAGMDGDELRRLMSLQATALSELGWYVGPSHDGFMAVCPLQWTAQAQIVASELDVGNVLGKMVLDFMKTDDEQARFGLPVNPS